MKLVQNTKRYADFNTADVVYFNGVRMQVYRPGWYEMERSDIYVAVVSPSGKINRIHFEELEVEAPEVPQPPAKKYDQTDFYQETETGALYKRQFGKDGWHLICASQIRPSIVLTSCDSSIPAGFKRLYKEA